MKTISLVCLKNKKNVKAYHNCPKFDAIPEIIIHKKTHIRCYNCKYLYNNS